MAPPVPHTDKALHFLSFFLLTATFYFILDTSRRRVLHLTLFVCTLCLGVGSEVLQGLLPNGREWDAWDVAANVAGSLCALGVAVWFHKRSAERKRLAKYSLVGGGEEGEDLELGERSAGVNGSVVVEGSEAVPPKSVEEEIDHWDENVADEEAWDEDDEIVPGHSGANGKVAAAVDGQKKAAVD